MSRIRVRMMYRVATVVEIDVVAESHEAPTDDAAPVALEASPSEAEPRAVVEDGPPTVRCPPAPCTLRGLGPGRAVEEEVSHG